MGRESGSRRESAILMASADAWVLTCAMGGSGAGRFDRSGCRGGGTDPPGTGEPSSLPEGGLQTLGLTEGMMVGVSETGRPQQWPVTESTPIERSVGGTSTSGRGCVGGRDGTEIGCVWWLASTREEWRAVLMVVRLSIRVRDIWSLMSAS